MDIGPIEWYKIADILATWSSSDTGEDLDITEGDYKAWQAGHLTDWDILALDKTADGVFMALVRSIKKYGFRDVLWYYAPGHEHNWGEDTNCHYNGHHRLFAALRLGYVWLPYNEHFEGDPDVAGQDPTMYDGDDFDKDEIGDTIYIHPENPKPKCSLQGLTVVST